MKVVYDEKAGVYLCIGHGFSFKAWFAGQGSEQCVEAEIFDKSGEILDYLYVSAPDAVVPSVAAVAAGLEPQLRRLRAQLEAP